jgi:hypothetical protein
VGRAIRTRRHTYGVTAPGAHGRREPAATRYVEDVLYDNESDPHQLTNLAGLTSHRDVADELRARLLARLAAAGEPPPPSTPPHHAPPASAAPTPL